jgi:RNA recognition motif-containing protein
VRDKKTRICKGYAFLEMVSEAAAHAVITALDGHPSGDRSLTVKLADQKK